MGVETVLLTETEQAVGWGNLAVKASCAPRCLPPLRDWPAEMRGELVWDASTFTSADDYTLTMSKAEVEEVKTGLDHFNGMSPLRWLASLLEESADQNRTRPLRKRGHARDVPASHTGAETEASGGGCPSWEGVCRGARDKPG